MPLREKIAATRSPAWTGTLSRRRDPHGVACGRTGETMDEPATTRASLLELLRDAPEDGAAWQEFVRIYAPPVLAWCHARGLQHADAEDVAQTVLVRFWRHAERFHYDPSRRFRHYLKRIVATTLADWHAEAPRLRLQSDADALAAAVASTPARDELADRLEAAFDLERLRVAMRDVERRVHPRTWQAFQLLALDHRPGRDVAALLGMEVNTAYAARSKVLRLIRETVAALAGEAAPEPGRPDPGNP